MRKPSILALRNALDYSPEKGIFRWKNPLGHRVTAGDVAGSTDSKGHIQIKLKGRLFFAHHLAWAFTHGEWPPDVVDHINGNRSDNRIENLRIAGRLGNSRNQRTRSDNRSGVKGVSWNSNAGKWAATIRYGGRKLHLGYFAEVADAEKVVRTKREELHGEFANHG